MKKAICLLLMIIPSMILFAQDQTINGNLTTVGDITLRTTEIPAPFGTWGKRLYFEIQVKDNDELIGEAMHIRYIVDIGRFMDKIN